MRFENDETRAVEAKLAPLIADRFGVTVGRWQDDCSRLDYWLEKNGKMVAVAELKSRPYSAGERDAELISWRKWRELNLAEPSAIAGVFVVAWADRWGWCSVRRIHPDRWPVIERKREPAGANDREPCTLIALEDFQIEAPFA